MEIDNGVELCLQCLPMRLVLRVLRFISVHHVEELGIGDIELILHVCLSLELLPWIA